MDDGRSWCLPIIMITALLAAFLYASIAAMTGIGSVTVRDRAAHGDKQAEKLYELLHGASGFMDHIRLLALLLAMAAATAATVWQQGVYAPLLTASLEKYGGGLAFLLAMLASVTATAIFAVRVPQLLGGRFADSFGWQAAGPARVIYAVFSPLCLLVRLVARGIGALFGAAAAPADESMTEEEIRLLVDTGNELGYIEESQKEMINNVFEFDDTTAGEVMTHRTEIIAVEREAKISEVVYLAINEGMSRLPVYEKDLDNILGIIYVKDLLCLVGCNSSEDFQISDFIRPVIYVPESVKCRALFAEFKKRKAHIAVVVDEYGGTAGLVSMEDVLESIVGEIEDEYDEQVEEIRQVADDTYIMEGTLELKKVGKLTGLDFTEEEDEDLDTLGGFLIHRLGHIPDKDETPEVIHEGWRFTVLGMDERRIDKVRLQRMKPPAEPTEA